MKNVYFTPIKSIHYNPPLQSNPWYGIVICSLHMMQYITPSCLMHDSFRMLCSHLKAKIGRPNLPRNMKPYRFQTRSSETLPITTTSEAPQLEVYILTR